jgi:hypothetical protein
MREYTLIGERTDLGRETFHLSYHSLQQLDRLIGCYVFTFGGFFGRLVEGSKVALYVLLRGTEMPPNGLKGCLTMFRWFNNTSSGMKLDTDSQ